MNETRNVYHLPILKGEMFGFKVKYVMWDGEPFYYRKDLSRHLKHPCATTGMTEGRRVFIKGDRIACCQFINKGMLDSLMRNIKSSKSRLTPFYKAWEESRRDKWFPGTGIKDMPDDMPLFQQAPIPSITAQAFAEMANRVKMLEKEIEEYRRNAPKPFSEVRIDSFDFKWSQAMALLKLYMNERLKVIPLKDGQSKEQYCRSLWNDFIMVELDSRLGSTLRSDHIHSKLPYKELVREKGMIDGFYSTVKKLLNFNG